MRRALAVLAVLAVAAAGCNGPLLDDGSEQVTDTVTPVTVAEPTPTADEPTPQASLPPQGVHWNGTVNVSRVADTHERMLGALPFTVALRANETARTGNGSVVSDWRRTIRVADEDVFVVRETVGNRTTEFYVNGTTGYSRQTTGDGERVHALRPPDMNAKEVYGSRTAGYVETYLPERTEATVVERDGRTFYRMHATEPPPSLEREVLVSVANVSNYSATAWLGPNGVVRALHVTYEYEGDGPPVRAAFRVDVRDVGVTAAERPDWVPADETTPQNGTATALNGTAAPSNGTESAPTATATPRNETGTNGTATTRPEA